MELNDKVAVITGGDSGIGLASARLFLEAGADVVIMSNNPETLVVARSQLGPSTTVLTITRFSGRSRGTVRDKQEARRQAPIATL